LNVEERMTIHDEKILLVSGPATISLLSGRAFILGMDISINPTIVKKGKTIPVETDSKATLVVKGMRKEQIQITDSEGVGSKIWEKYMSNLIQGGHKSFLILGDTDSGKSTLSVYLTNLLLRSVEEVTIIDADVGQNDLGPPGFIGLGRTSNQIIDLRDIKVDQFYYYGSITPSTNPKYINELISRAYNKARSSEALIINTDGYVKGDGINIKKELIERIRPQMVLYLGSNEGLENFLHKKGINHIFLPTVLGIAKSRLDRKEKRELQYLAFLRKVKKNFKIDVNKVPLYLFGQKLKSLKVIKRHKLGSVILDEDCVYIGEKDLSLMIVSLVDETGIERIGWVSKTDGNYLMVKCEERPKNIKAISLGLIRFDGRREQILSYEVIIRESLDSRNDHIFL
jgi:polynucleotide 5'-hydroxyl-kinase GRC3/NOL9